MISSGMDPQKLSSDQTIMDFMAVEEKKKEADQSANKSKHPDYTHIGGDGLDRFCDDVLNWKSHHCRNVIIFAAVFFLLLSFTSLSFIFIGRAGLATAGGRVMDGFKRIQNNIKGKGRNEGNNDVIQMK